MSVSVADGGLPAEAGSAILDDFLREVAEAATRARAQLAQRDGSSRRLGGRDFVTLAVDAGMPVRRQYTVAEVAEATGKSRSAIYKAIHDGDLPCELPAGFERGALLYPEDVDEWRGL